MSIGLYDADLVTYKLVPFNLEIMKLAAYYKKKREIVILSPQLLPDRHEKVFVRKDYDDGNFPTKILMQPNVEFGGLAFGNNVYQPLPIEIERMRPDTAVYESMEKLIRWSKLPAIRHTVYQQMITAEHMRLSLDGKTIWPEYGKQFKNLKGARHLILHDYDLGKVEGALTEVKGILARARNDGWATRLGMKFPPNIYTGDDLLGWTSLNPNDTFYSLRYNGLIPMEDFWKYVGQYNNKAIYSEMEYYIDYGCSDEDDFIKNRIREIYRQVIIARSYRAHFSLKYSDGFFKDPMWEKVIKIFNFFLGYLLKNRSSKYYLQSPHETLYTYAKNSIENPPPIMKYKVMPTSEIREIFAFVREKNPALFKDFYECDFYKIKEEQNR